jgi:hypothetical protein
MVLPCCLGLAVTDTLCFLIAEGLHLMHVRLEAGLIGQAGLWVLLVLQLIGAVVTGGVTRLVVVVRLTASFQLYVPHVSDFDVSERLLPPANLSLGCWTTLFGSRLWGRLGSGDEDVLLLLH